MRTILINSLIYNRVILKQIADQNGLIRFDIELLAIIDSVSELSSNKYCEIADITKLLPSMEYQEFLYKSIRKLLSKGFILRAGNTRKKYKLVLSGSGDYILREYSKVIHQSIREMGGIYSKRLKYSFLKGNE
jgi:hypothetical protein